MREKDVCSKATRSVEERDVAGAHARNNGVPAGEVDDRGRLSDTHGTHDDQVDLVSDAIIHVEAVR